jgi:hypothetical protein
MNKTVKIIIEIVLAIIAVVLLYQIVQTILIPIKFQKRYNIRREAVIAKLKKIRDIEIAYDSKYHHYTASWDTLINFAKHDSIIVVKAYGTVPDSIYLKAKNPHQAELRALKLGIIRRDTLKIAVKDTLFKEPYDIDTIKYVPYTHLKEVFQINAGYITTEVGMKMPVFEVKVHNDTYLKGLNRQMVINLNDEARRLGRFPGLVVGSMTEVSTSGNWQ